MATVQRLRVGAVELAFRVDGRDDAPALLLLNSIGTDTRLWEPQVETFAANHRVVRYDYPGHGESGTPPGALTIDDLASQAVALLDHLALDRAHLCGLSLGGQVAMVLASTHADRVARAVFAATAPRIGTSELWDARISAALMGGMHLIRSAVLQRFFSDTVRHTHAERVTAVREMLEAATPTGYAAVCAALRDADLTALVGSIRAPSLVVAGARDVSTPLEQLHALHAALASSELVVLDAAHLLNVEAPEEFTQCVLAFLAREPGAAA